MSRSPGDLIIKDPDSSEPIGFDWTAYLAELGVGVTISTSTYAVSPSGLTLTNAGIVAGNLKTVVTMSAGTVAVKYTVTNHIVTSSGVIDDRSCFVLVQQR